MVMAAFQKSLLKVSAMRYLTPQERQEFSKEREKNE